MINNEKKSFNFRTDLASERRDLYRKANSIENEIRAKYNIDKDTNIENKTIELKDAITEATINIDKTTLTTLEKNENVKIIATLLSDEEKYNLYKTYTSLREDNN